MTLKAVKTIKNKEKDLWEDRALSAYMELSNIQSLIKITVQGIMNQDQFNDKRFLLNDNDSIQELLPMLQVIYDKVENSKKFIEV